MSHNETCFFPRRLFLPLATSALVTAGPLSAATINYGDFIGGTVRYRDVSETAASSGDTEPLYGPPTVGNNYLDFDPAGFASTAVSGGADVTDGQLRFTLEAVTSYYISSIALGGRGDATVFGTGTATTQAGFALSVGSITLLEVDGAPLASPVSLAPASNSGTLDLSNNPGQLSSWNIGLAYDIGAAMTNAGVVYQHGATRLELTIDSSLSTVSEASSIAFLAEKDFFFDAQTSMYFLFAPPAGSALSPIPEPSVSLLFSLAAALLYRRRRDKPAPSPLP